MDDPAYLRRLGRTVRGQRTLVDPRAEARAWQAMLEELGLLPVRYPSNSRTGRKLRR